MHYRNGREAHNGDKIVSLDGQPGYVTAVGVLRDAQPGNEYCNGYIQQGPTPMPSDPIACMCDCLHIEDVAAILAEKGLDKRPETPGAQIPEAKATDEAKPHDKEAKHHKGK